MIRRSIWPWRPSASRRWRGDPRSATRRRGRWQRTSSAGWLTSRSRPGASRPRGARRWARRNRTAVTAAAATLLAAIVGLAVVLAVQTKANRDLTQANTALAGSISRERKAYADLQDADGRERERFDLAVEAIRRFHTNVSEDFLLKQDEFKVLRDRLLRDAVEFYRKLEARLSGQGDHRSRRALARSYEEVGELTAKIGSIPEGLEAHRKALGLRRSMALEAPSDPEARADVGRSVVTIGILLTNTGRLEEALGSFAEARAVLGGPSGPAQTAIQGEIARSHYWAGSTLYFMGRARQAIAAYEEARAISNGLVATHPESVDYQRMLSWSHNDIGLLMLQAGRIPEALIALEASLRIKRKIADDHPGDAESRRDLATTHANIGLALRESGRTEAALAAHEMAMAIQQDLAVTYPAVSQIQSDLANSLNDTGDDLRFLGRTAEAPAYYERAIAIVDVLTKANPTVTANQANSPQAIMLQGLRGLGATQLAGGRLKEAIATWRRAVRIGETIRQGHAEGVYFVASCHAQLGGVAGRPGSGMTDEDGRAELDAAIIALRQAVAAGYVPVGWMRRDRDLAPLRSRPDFQALLLDLAFPADPFARAD